MSDEWQDLLCNQVLDFHGQVRRERLEDLLVEVSSGKVLFTAHTGDLFASRSPTTKETDTGRILYAKSLHEARKQGLKSRSELEEMAIRTGQFDVATRQEKVNLEDMIKRFVSAREQTADPGQKITLDSDINKARSKLLKIEMTEEEIFRFSAESLADSTRLSYMVSCCTLAGDLLDDPVWKSWEEFQNSTDLAFLFDARKAFVRVSQGLPIKIIRALARTGEWRVKWKSSQESGSPPFDGVAGGWNKNQLSLIYWSDFYDSVYAHPESPPEETIQNDEYLQTWINQQVMKNKQAKAKVQSAGGKTIYQNTGSGKKAMAKVGESTKTVNAPFKRRV